MKAAVKIFSLITLTMSLNAFAQEDRMVAHLDLGLHKEVTQVSPGEIESVTGIVPQTEEEIEIADVDAAGEAD